MQDYDVTKMLYLCNTMTSLENQHALNSNFQGKPTSWWTTFSETPIKGNSMCLKSGWFFFSQSINSEDE